VRNVPPFSCLSCGSSSPKQARCARCGGEVVDTNGVAPLASVQVRPNAFGVVGSLGTWFADRLAGRRAARRVEGAGPLRAIVDARDGTEHIRGRVRVIRAVRAPDGTDAAAFHTRTLRSARDAAAPPRSPDGRPMARWIEEGTACGAFLVADGSGLALVDDDAVDLEHLGVEPLTAAADGMVALRDGDVVEVSGPAAWGPPPPELVDARLTPSTPLLCFDGRAEARLTLVLLPLTATLPIPRFKSTAPSAPGSPPTREHEALSEMEAAGRADVESRGRNTGRD
jgi:hypothetical protein